jgi:hypothetical protein
MLLTGRQAATLLRAVVSSDEQARLLLRTGIAGPGARTSASLLFDELAVREVSRRPLVVSEALWEACPEGLYVIRLPRSVDLDVASEWQEVARQVRGAHAHQRRMPALTSALTSVQIKVRGSLPLAATFLGFVVLAADLVGLDADGPRLAPPGPWASVVEGHRLPTRSGGRPGYLLTPPRGGTCAETAG